MAKDIFLTFDMDWASDGVLEYLYDIMEKYDLKGTLNVTHRTVFLNRARSCGRFELGLHPNFNPLLNGGVLAGLLRIF